MIFRKGFLLAFYVLLYLIPLNLRPLWIPDETRYAEIPREILSSGNWVVPHFLGLRYFEKPIFGYWVNAVSQWLLGDSNFAVRFGQALATGLSALLIYWMGSRIWDSRRKAGAAVLIYLSCLLVYAVGTDAVLDSIFSFWMNAAMVSFYLTVMAQNHRDRAWGYVLLGVSCGFGFLTKGFIALAVPVVAAVPFMLQQRRFLELLRYGLIAVVVAAVVALPWALAVNHRDPDYWRYFFWVQNIQRFSSADAQHSHPVWYYLPILILGTLPWTGLAWPALRAGWRNMAQRRNQLYLAAWVIFPVLFFSASRGKLPTYILPSFAPLAMLIGSGLIDYIDSGRSRAISFNAWLNVAFGAACAAALAWMYFQPGAKVTYAPGDKPAFVIGVSIFLDWAVLGLLQLGQPSRRWFLAAFSPLPLALFFTQALPAAVVDSKLPANFIHQHEALLEKAHTLLSNDVGLAAGLAWNLKRSHIDLFNDKGELRYGLSYPDGQGRYVDQAQFPQWLRQARTQGEVAMLLHIRHPDKTLAQLPRPDKLFERGDFTLLVYQASSP